MSRYSPQVLPTDVDPLAIAISRLASGFEEGQDRSRADADRTRNIAREGESDSRARDEFALKFHEQGGRYGDALEQLASTVGPGSGRPQPQPGLTPSVGDHSTDPGFSGGIDANGLAAALADRSFSLRPPKPPTPGAFDGTGFFGVTRPRFEQIRPETTGQRGMFIDNAATPAAERAVERSAAAKTAADYRRGDIRARGDEAMDLERLRQQGRTDLRDKINAAGAANIMLRETQRAGRGGTAMTAGQKESMAMKSADGIIGASAGNYDNAIDWLTNTPEGQAAAKAGLEPRHLYAALGKYIGATTAQATRLETGPAGLEPHEATAAVSQTRSRVASGTRTPTTKRTITQAQYDAARAQGHDDATIAKSYNVPTSVKRKP